MRLPNHTDIDQIELGELKATDEDTDEIESIAASIKEIGQLTPVTVHTVNGKSTLVFGLKRYLAMVSLGEDTIKTEEFSGTPEDLGIARLHENLKRAHLPWHVEAKLTKELHEMKQADVGAAPTKGGGRQKSGWGIRDTAALLGVATGRASENISLARAVAADPSLSKVQDKKTAVRLVRQRAKREEQEDESVAVPSNIEQDACYLGSSVDVLKRFPEGVFNACLTDPPWLKFAPDKSLIKDKETDAVFKEVYRVLRIDSFLAMFVGFDDFTYYQKYLPTLGFRVQETPCIWKTVNRLSRRSSSGWQFARDVEFILIAVKGAPLLTSSTQLSCHFDFKVVPPASMVHPNEKPVKLLRDLLQKIAHPEATILEPFGGSFAVPVAARLEAMHYVAIERNPEFFEAGKKRLKSVG